MDCVIQHPLKEYDASIFTEENQANTYLCTICQFICHDVVSVECGNGHIFCRSCMETYVKHSKQCPNCQKPITSIHDAKFVDRLIQSLQVKCISCIPSYIQPYSNKISSQCQWKGALREADKHYQIQCPYALLRCKQCGMDDILRKDSNSHFKNECPYTVIECLHKNQGCTATMARKKLQQHLEKFCSFRSLHCPYTKHGCLFTKKNGKLNIKDLQKHLTDNQYRILHLELQIHSLTKQLESNKNQIQYNINNNNININNNINHSNIAPYHSANTINNKNNNMNLLFAFVGSDEGKYTQKNNILCIDVQNGISQTILDPLSIALINHNIHNVPNTGTEEKYDRSWDIRNHGACCANNLNINNDKCTVLFRVGGWNAIDEQESAVSHVDGYVVQHNQWLHNLPDLPSCSSGCGCIYSNNYGLMVVGGESPAVTDTLYQLPFGIHDDDDKQEEKNKELKWKKLKSMKRARTNLAVTSFIGGERESKNGNGNDKREYIFVCGGYNDGESLKWCELYDFYSNQWQDLPKSMYRHQSAGCCYWENGNGINQNCMIIIGGYPEAKLVEEYSFYKNKWYKLPSTQHNHQFLPSIWVYTDPKINPNGCGILLCAGNRCNLKPLNDRTATGYVEFFDKRESIQKWHTLYSLRDLIYFGLHCKIDSKEDDGRRVRRIFR